jgi:FkbM family methyltransferase
MVWVSPHKVLLGKLQRLIGSSTIGVKLAIKIKNQMDAVIRQSLNDGIDMSCNGEILLMDSVAHKATLFIDVGANTGSWAMPFLSRMKPGGKGLLFEPSPIAAKMLKDNFGQTKNVVEIIRAAVGDKSGRACFFMEPAAGETSSLVMGHSQSGAQEIEVPVTTIDEELLKRNIDFVDFLKIDAEGYDLRVMMGAMNSIKGHKIGIVQFEYNAPWALVGSTLSDAIKLFRTNGYLVYLLLREGLYIFEYEIYGEYFGYSNFVAVLPDYWPEHGELVVGKA